MRVDRFGVSALVLALALGACAPAGEEQAEAQAADTPAAAPESVQDSATTDTAMGQDDYPVSSAAQIHDRTFTLDTHVDIGPGYGTDALDPGEHTHAQVDLPKMVEGGLDAAFFIVYVGQGDLTEEGYAAAREAAEEKYRGISRMLANDPDRIALATTAGAHQATTAGEHPATTAVFTPSDGAARERAPTPAQPPGHQRTARGA